LFIGALPWIVKGEASFLFLRLKNGFFVRKDKRAEENFFRKFLKKIRKLPIDNEGEEVVC